MLLSLGLSLDFPAADVLDAVYDESEAVPYEGTPVLSSIVVPLTSARIPKAEFRHRGALHSESLMKCGKACREDTARLLSDAESFIVLSQPFPLRC